MAIQATVKGLDKAQRRFKRIQKRLMDPKDAMEIIAGLGFKNVIDHFDKSMGPSGKWRRPKRRQGKPLQDTGRLMNSTTFRVVKDQAIVANDAVYAGVHNFGYRKRNIPKRKFMYIDKKTQKEFGIKFAKVVTKK